MKLDEFIGEIQKAKADSGYKLSEVADGLWTVEGEYPPPTDPEEYFKPSPLYTNLFFKKATSSEG